MVQASPSPLLAKAELTKLRFAQLLERTSVMCHRSFVSDRVSFYDGSYRRAEFPFFAKKGWTRPQENAAKLPLIGADGVVVSSYRLSYPNRFDKRWLETTTPSAPARKADFLFMAQPPLLREEGEYACQTVCSILDSSALRRRGGRDL